MADLGATGQHQLVSSVIKTVKINILVRILLIRITGGVVIPSDDTKVFMIVI